MLIPTWLLIVPLVVQAAAMAFDELHYHRSRGLGAWERLGHPLDTLTVVACIGWALCMQPTAEHVVAYIALAAVSCLFVTKDEFVHARRCSAGEHWLHALLFIVHPVALASIGLLWLGLHAGAGVFPSRLQGNGPGWGILFVQFCATAVFGVYQAWYWNLRWPSRARLGP
ncbi:MAG: hypothetical protein FWD17_12630 [Polyangiaceae bacterium]|nr:hypothetical protein [Polyangiaceae bacterium]